MTNMYIWFTLLPFPTRGGPGSGWTFNAAADPLESTEKMFPVDPLGKI